MFKQDFCKQTGTCKLIALFHSLPVNLSTWKTVYKTLSLERIVRMSQFRQLLPCTPTSYQIHPSAVKSEASVMNWKSVRTSFETPYKSSTWVGVFYLQLKNMGLWNIEHFMFYFWEVPLSNFHFASIEKLMFQNTVQYSTRWYLVFFF